MKESFSILSSRSCPHARAGWKQVPDSFYSGEKTFFFLPRVSHWWGNELVRLVEQQPQVGGVGGCRANAQAMMQCNAMSLISLIVIGYTNCIARYMECRQGLWSPNLITLLLLLSLCHGVCLFFFFYLGGIFWGYVPRSAMTRVPHTLEAAVNGSLQLRLVSTAPV
jgi:hypothetical protein